LYKTTLSLHNDNIFIPPWISFVKITLDSLGMSEYFINQRVDNFDHFKSSIKNRQHDQFYQEWKSTLNVSPKCLVYRVYKRDYCFEEYLVILSASLRKSLCKFRTMNHSMQIEKGRHLGIERNQRLCTLCSKSIIGDEFHYSVKRERNHFQSIVITILIH